MATAQITTTPPRQHTTGRHRWLNIGATYPERGASARKFKAAAARWEGRARLLKELKRAVLPLPHGPKSRCCQDSADWDQADTSNPKPSVQRRTVVQAMRYDRPQSLREVRTARRLAQYEIDSLRLLDRGLHEYAPTREQDNGRFR